MAGVKVFLESLRRGLKVDLIREVARQYPFICFVLVSMLSSTIVLNRYLYVLMTFWFFLAGAITFYCSLSPDSLVPNVLVSITTKDKQPEQQELFPQGHSCTVCGKNKCRRHRPALLLENYQPWLGLKVHSKVDASIGEVLELVLENFVYPWYRDITDDEACVDELRQTFRFFASVLVRRVQKVNIPSVATGKMLKAAMKHIEIAAKAQQKVGKNRTLQQVALEEYGADLHVALRSRRDELLYLRKLTEMLFPYVMPPKATDCRSLSLLIREVMTGSVFLPTMDFIADPDTVNHLVLLFIDDTPPEPATEPPSALVPFLQKYADSLNKNLSVLKLDLKEIREQQDLLFRFMSFLKQEGAVHVLQFCLAVEEFNDKILCPELSDFEMQCLHSEVKKIYVTYCLDESIDKISFDPFIIEEIRNIAEGSYTGVVKLQKMTCLFEAYEHVLSLLENVFTPMFCHSDEYFRYLLCGVESPLRNAKLNRNLSLDDLRNPPKRGESFGISRIGSKLKGVFKSSTMEGAMPPSYTMVDGEEDTVRPPFSSASDLNKVGNGPTHSEVEEATVVVEDESPVPVEVVATPGTQRNLSAWTICIPFIDFWEDEAKKERLPVFCIDVERHDREQVGHETESWSVLRRYLEFYVLESKLTEFHGSFQDAQLPSKRIIGPKNFEFLTSKRLEFEEYLQNLLRHPELSNSQLLADFLSPYSTETQFLDKMLPDVNLGRIFKSVPGKLIKEKGQNLEPFLQSFFVSCEQPRPKPSRPELTVLSPTAGSNKKLNNELYKNNAAHVDTMDKKHKQNYFFEPMELEGVYDYMMFVGRVVFHMPDWLHHMLAAGRILFKKTLEAYMDQYLQNKLDQILQEHRLVSLITLLRDAVFCENNEERSPEDKQRRAKQTFEEMMNYLPDTVVKCIGEENKYEGIQLLFNCLQQPLLNKQITYVLLDIAVEELFPELSAKTQETARCKE
ncbi:sorting nexin-14 isoform X1 [Silurus meridionalis]|uniref:sorting nexin-14 isoform X1 n=1 Tax=Silurus meridionalis TaxID=175797 RepID=UPI001EEAFD5B|nr:sorting nexin-14 isoform X1 [Silurus meridionalis]XP_046728449.1 sorting nexin-14 isoform X1 [Silurus meridionalis]XP_046728450.1 sorting nexin-14 isoform X1 [Silurus meridionalis]